MTKTSDNHDKPCPSCGHCPTCGRGGVPSYGWWQVVPYWQPPYYNPITWTSPNFTVTSDTRTYTINN